MADPNPFIDWNKPAAPASEAAAPAAQNPFAKWDAPPEVAAPSAAGEGNRYDLGEVPGAMAENFVPSLKKHGEELWSGVTEHPGEFAGALAQFSPGNPVALAKATWGTLKGLYDKYGSWDKAKTSAAEDPSGFLMDLTSFLPMTGGAGAVSATTRAGKVAQVAGHAAELADPSRALTTLRRIASKGGDVAAATADQAVQALEGIGTGALKEMFESGKAATPDVWKTLTGGLDFEKSYDMIQSSLGKLYEERHNNYDSAMHAIEGADKPVDFSKVDKAVGDAGKIGVYKAKGDKGPGAGYQYERDPTVLDARAKILAEIEKYRMMGPAYHTAFGFDKLKQAITTIGSGLEEGGMPTRGSKFANDVAGSVRKTIMDEVPEYGKVMSKYGSDTDEIKNLIKEFSLKDGNQLATLRKLQKVWRQSADVAHGERTNQLREAVKGTGNEALMSNLAAGQFHPWLPRGLRGTFLPAEAMANPTALGKMLPFQSPRVSGATAYGLGRLTGSPFAKVPAASYDIAEKTLPNVARVQRWAPQQPPPAEKRGGFFRGAK